MLAVLRDHRVGPDPRGEESCERAISATGRPARRGVGAVRGHHGRRCRHPR